MLRNFRRFATDMSVNLGLGNLRSRTSVEMPDAVPLFTISKETQKAYQTYLIFRVLHALDIRQHRSNSGITFASHSCRPAMPLLCMSTLFPHFNARYFCIRACGILYYSCVCTLSVRLPSPRDSCVHARIRYRLHRTK